MADTTCSKCEKSISVRAVAHVVDDQVLCSRCRRAVIARRERDQGPPTESQLNYARDVGLVCAEGITFTEISEMLARYERGELSSADTLRPDLVPTFIALADECRVARIHYLKPGERTATVRLVEPHGLYETARHCLAVECWQIDPRCEGEDAWRLFRLDRVRQVEDGEQLFEPRRPITMAGGEVLPYSRSPRSKQSLLQADVDAYAKYIDHCLMDGRITQEEINGAVLRLLRLPEAAAHKVHSDAYAECIRQINLDGVATTEEVMYAQDVRAFLEHIGWQQ